jgi:release factor glutamine methyltransferase
LEGEEPERRNRFKLLDVGTGTGCIAITLAFEFPSLDVTAIDVSPAALKLAQSNATRLGTNIHFIESNWFASLPSDARFDIIVSNPPYIVPGDTHLSQGDLRFEPSIALADSVDGLQSYRELANGAMNHLNPGGWLIVEHGYDQGESVPALFREAGFVDVEMKRDLADLPRVTIAQMPR